MACLTRREMAALLFAAPALAQTSPAASNEQAPPAPRTLDAANDLVRQAADKLKALSVAIDVEPAFVFKV
jgi:hypothetical protein